MRRSLPSVTSRAAALQGAPGEACCAASALPGMRAVQNLGAGASAGHAHAPEQQSNVTHSSICRAAVSNAGINAQRNRTGKTANQVMAMPDSNSREGDGACALTTRHSLHGAASTWHAAWRLIYFCASIWPLAVSM